MAGKHDTRSRIHRETKKDAKQLVQSHKLQLCFCQKGLSEPLSVYQSVHMVRLAGQRCSGATFGEIALWQEGQGRGDVVQDEGWINITRPQIPPLSIFQLKRHSGRFGLGFVWVVKLLCFLSHLSEVWHSFFCSRIFSFKQHWRIESLGSQLASLAYIRSCFKLLIYHVNG